MPKKSGFLDKIKGAIMEGDDASSPEPEQPTASASAAPAPNFGFGLRNIAPQAVPPVTAAPNSVLLAPLDPAAVEQVESGVYVDFGGRPSKLLKFVQMWQKLGRPNTPDTVIQALQVFDASFTKQAILEDLAGHFKLLDNTAAQAKAAFDDASKQDVGGAQQQITDMTAKNEADQTEITRLQNAIAERNAAIQALTAQAQQATAKIAAAAQKTDAATTKVRADLTQLQQLVSSAS